MTTAEADVLTRAVRNNEVELLQQLLAAGADGNQLDSSGETALTVAIKEALSMQRSYEFATVQTLLQAGCDANARNALGEHPLLLALNHQLVPGRKVLRPRNLASDQAAIVCRLLIDAGADVNVVEQDGTTALMIALVARCPEIVWALLQHGALVVPSNECGGTALMCAVAPYRAIGMIIPRLTCGIECSAEAKPMGSAEEVSALLERGGDVRAVVRQGKSVTELAAMAVPGYQDLLALFTVD